MSSILTNNGAMVALQTMRQINRNMETVQDQISTGMKVGSAKDNAATWAISKVMESDVAGFRAIKENLALGSSTVNVARNAAETTTKLLTEIKEKVVQAQEDNVDRAKIQEDIRQLRDQIQSVTSSAQFNGLNLVSGYETEQVLASLDRSGTGVAPTSINVLKQDLTMTEEAMGTEAARTDGPGLTAPGDTGNAATTTFEFGAAPAEETNTFSINGIEVSYESSATPATNAANLAAAINDNAELEALGITANATAAEVTLSLSGEARVTGVTLNNDGNATFTAGNAPEDVAAAGAEIALGTEAVQGGDSFRVSLDGVGDFTFVANARSTNADVLNSLADQINEQGDVFAEVRDGSLFVAQRDGTAGSEIDIEVEVTSGGTAAGGLQALNEIDVADFESQFADWGDMSAEDRRAATRESLEASLGSIEALIQTSIDAASEFGQVQKRIEIQSDFVGNLMDSLRSGIGALVDADMEETSARLQALQVQQQLGIQSLTIANQQPQNILALFR